ncbi:MAG: T9SS type A sorting domain-containing protein [Bacteroidales bacterium]|jgi:alpha-tubulin suppressor-like RCC1 family protein|nr:T9SS type A sorting domain-containing protein [Bacteroidales bacterium]
MKDVINFLWIIILSMNMLTAQNWHKVTAGSEFSLGIKEDGTLWSWGFNGDGQLGVLTEYSYEHSPIQIGVDMDWKMVSAGGAHVLALKNDGTLWGWGLNNYGQVEDTIVSNFFAPEQIGSDTNWVLVETCFGSSFAMKRDGTLWAWGFNQNGELGINSLTQPSHPTQVGVGKWKSISSGGFFSMGIQEDNTLWHWGPHFLYSEEEGYTITLHLIPTQIDTDTDWVSVAVGMEYAIALKKDGSLWVYGDNTNGQLGYADTVFANTFFQIVPEKKWVSIEAGSVYAFAIDENNVLYGWGNNLYGQLGFYTGNNVTIPMPVSVHSIVQISAAKGILFHGRIYGLHTLMLDSNREMCVAGANYVGQLGTGTIFTGGTERFICSYTNIISADENIGKDIIVFPNPARDCFFVTNVQNANIILYDLLGKEICSQYSKEEQATFYTENISAGLYILKIQKEREIVSRKIQITK